MFFLFPASSPSGAPIPRLSGCGTPQRRFFTRGACSFIGGSFFRYVFKVPHLFNAVSNLLFIPSIMLVVFNEGQLGSVLTLHVPTELLEPAGHNQGALLCSFWHLCKFGVGFDELLPL